MAVLSAAAAARRLRAQWVSLTEMIITGAVAWIATPALHHPQAFFAPAAALIVLGQTRGQRARRAVEVCLGVADGVLVAEALAHALGPQTTPTVVVVLGATLTLAVAVGATTIADVQAAVSALYIAVVAPPTQHGVPTRFLDASSEARRRSRSVRSRPIGAQCGRCPWRSTRSSRG
jgi:uncharacterized membrane protein YgaE (UPF0421/DUF939 family)